VIARRAASQGFLTFPFGNTVVMGGSGRSEVLATFGGELSFLGFFDILLLRCSPLGMEASLEVKLPM
jgi:hypothetical protein